MPSYTKFFNAYAKTPFTENYDKYIKYTPEALDALVTQVNCVVCVCAAALFLTFAALSVVRRQQCRQEEFLQSQLKLKPSTLARVFHLILDCSSLLLSLLVAAL